MKIKGVEGGRNRGEPIEYTPPEKVVLAVQDAVSHDAVGHRAYFPGLLAAVERPSFVTEKFNYSPKGDLLKGKWQNNTYSAEGMASILIVDLKSDTARPTRKIRYRIRFEDALDTLGQPDLTVSHFEIIP
jgi:hypothetical protein